MKGMRHKFLRKKLVPVLLLIGLSQVLFAKSKIDGDWEGALENGKLPMIFHIRLQGGSTVDSPKQNVQGMLAMASLSGNSVKVDMPGGAAEFEGVLKGSQIVGTFSQTGQKLPLTLTKSS